MRTLLATLAALLTACGPMIAGPDADGGACAPWCRLDALPDGGQSVVCGTEVMRGADAGGLPWCSTCDLVRADGGQVERLECY